MHVHLSPPVYIDLDGAWTSPDTRTRAASPARAVSDTMLGEIRATPLFFLLLFHPESSARPCVGYLLLYSRYLDTFHDLLLSFVTSAVSSSPLFFSLLFYTANDSSLGPSFSSSTRARYRLDTFPILYHVFMRFCHSCLLTHPTFAPLHKIPRGDLRAYEFYRARKPLNADGDFNRGPR